MADVDLSGAIVGSSGAAAAVAVTVSLAGLAAAAAAAEGVLERSVRILEPADLAELVPPQAPIAFDLLATSAKSYAEDFEGADFPPWFELCTPANGYTHANWNSGADAWDLYQDGADKVLRAQGRATAIAAGAWRAALHTKCVEIVCRVRWYTGATAGVFSGFRFYDTAGKTGSTGVRGYAAEIDSGGLRLLWYDDGTRRIEQTVAFTPASGSWYWIKLRAGASQWAQAAIAKYWTGAREDEPSTWSTSWKDQGISDATAERWRGNGVRCHAGTAYFDKFEIDGQIDPAFAARLTVDVNGVEFCSGAARADRRVAIESDMRDEVFYAGFTPVTVRYPEVANWRCWIFPPADAYRRDGAQTVTVKFDGAVLKTWSFETSDFPLNPCPDAGAGDPSRLTAFEVITSATTVPRGARFAYTTTLFLSGGGAQDVVFAVCSLTWRLDRCDFEYLVDAKVYTPINGRYLIAHPIGIVVPASVVPGLLRYADHPASVVPKGALEHAFPAGLIVQGYVRREFPASLCPYVRFLYRGRASGVVSVAFLSRVAGSGLVFEALRDGVADIEVIDEATYQALLEAGVTWS